MASKKEWKATAKNYEALYREALQWRNFWYDRAERLAKIVRVDAGYEEPEVVGNDPR